MKIPFEEIVIKAKFYEKDITKFLRDMIAIPSESCEEKKVIERIKQEMIKVGFDHVSTDPMGNLFGKIGHGKHLIAMDGHIDTVGIGEIKNWKFDPYIGFEDDKLIGGRGGSDQEGGMASMVYAGKIIKDLKLEGDYTLLVTATVQEEDCDGLCWQYIIEEDKIKPEFVVITEPTSCRIYRGHRGRMEIKVMTSGISCHGSAPERGDNAIYKMAPILLEVEQLNKKLKDDPFLGKGTMTVSQIYHTSPSRCAVADGCWISIDRRLTHGETYESALDEIRRLPSVIKAKATVEMYTYERPSYTGLLYPTQSYFPTWVLPSDHVVCESAVDAYQGLFKKNPVVDKWTFSTNGVSIMGRHNIPCIGFGPGHEDQAHAPNEITFKEELVTACAMYAAIPLMYMEHLKKGDKQS
ncbi:MAG TPA: YgeY family selenium metabolism-linked hydrolase [Acholeplasmataceae bacterium]|nr:MAG: selenium metabolism hydrolase [Tenericutes bacterium GWA2_38_26]OHE30484.1 MAG: selenium metabolism hydrolase [Tenericutes bacterium GWC2_39_45]OHE32670.1 MAG: selenium metabolism hydrolase [Tenericutes bacterium GWD2_38_27]OHE37714.1 MAG: selenium metabolism hydrolase [Tenericutes bacterium GWE2_38_8]OHE41386.1 MAG: selenium metabolism hydrolase [Tenericutes bacterium GWF2_38_8]HBG33687.1 YgeY family selenium metabolism-linked hydrolase [Acholeplasmataceae bacterium]